MPQSDTEYFRQRAEAERALAKSAAKASVAAIHDELARGYEALVRYEELRPVPFSADEQPRSAWG